MVSIFANCNSFESKQSIQKPIFTIDSFDIPNTTVRALAAINDQEIWFAGSNGRFGYTTNAGKSWFIDSIIWNKKGLEFRSIALGAKNEVFMLSVTEPAVLIKYSKAHQSWTQDYLDTNNQTFLDMIAINRENKKFMVGDPIEGFFQFLIQDDDKNWTRIDRQSIPESLINEAPFAASNSNIRYINSQICIITGGKSGSRIFRSSDHGKHWRAYSTPLISGAQMTGGFSLDFDNPKYGIAAGGNWDSVEQLGKHLIFSSDSGKSWLSLQFKVPYLSCVRWVPNSNSTQAIALSGRARGGTSSMHFIDLAEDTIYHFNNTNYLSMVFSSDSIAWLGGRNKIAKMSIIK